MICSFLAFCFPISMYLLVFLLELWALFVMLNVDIIFGTKLKNKNYTLIWKGLIIKDLRVILGSSFSLKTEQVSLF